MKKNSAESWLDEALDALLYHEEQRSECAKLGSIAVSRAHKHSRMYHGILYAHNLAIELLEENNQLKKKLYEKKKQKKLP